MSSAPLTSTVEPTAPAAAAPASLAPFRAGFWFGGFNALTWIICLGTPMVLLAQQLGASAFQVGLASSFVFLLLPVQVVSTAALSRFGFKRQMVLAWSVRAPFLLVPLGLAWIAPERPARWMPGLLVASVFGFCLFRAIGTAAHMPWMAAILPLGLRGRYFATDQAITSLVGVTVLVGCAVLFATVPAHDAFRILYLTALIGAIAAVWSLARLPSAPAPAAPPLRSMAARALALCLHRGHFRHYLLLLLADSVVSSSLVAFTIYYLKVVHALPSSELMLFTAAQFAGQIAGAWGIRHFVDGVPLRRFFQMAVALVGVVELFWLALLNGAEVLLSWLGGAYFLFGMGTGMAHVAHFTYLPELSNEAERPITIAIFTAVLGLLSGVAPILWGLALKGGGPAPAIDAERFVLFFAIGATLSGLLLVLYARLPDLRSALER